VILAWKITKGWIQRQMLQILKETREHHLHRRSLGPFDCRGYSIHAVRVTLLVETWIGDVCPLSLTIRSQFGSLGSSGECKGPLR
jgi:hypothetical protein